MASPIISYDSKSSSPASNTKRALNDAGSETRCSLNPARYVYYPWSCNLGRIVHDDTDRNAFLDRTGLPAI